MQIMSRGRLEECKKYIMFMPSEARLKDFYEKLKNKGPKLHYFALKLFTGASKLYSWASKSRGQGGGPGPPSPPPPDPLVFLDTLLLEKQMLAKLYYYVPAYYCESQREGLVKWKPVIEAFEVSNSARCVRYKW